LIRRSVKQRVRFIERVTERDEERVKERDRERMKERDRELPL